MQCSVVGLDLSLTSTGVATELGTLSIAVKSKGCDRLIELREAILDVVLSLHQPVVCVEGYSFGSKNSQAHAAGELGGVVRVALWEEGVRFVEIAPTSRAKFATGKGNAGKTEVISAVCAKTGIQWSGKGADDECDAWILREMGLVHFGHGQFNWPVANLSALEKIDWTPFQSYHDGTGESPLLIHILESN